MAANNYIALADVKAYMPNNDVSTTTQWDALVTTLCTNLSRAFDTLTFRKPGAYAMTTSASRYFDGVPQTAGDFANSIFIDELAAAPTSVSISKTGSQTGFVAMATTDYLLWPYNAADDGKPYLRIDLNLVDGQTKAWPSQPRSVQVTGPFGYSATVPADVQEALLLYAVRMLRKAQQNYLQVGQILDSGQIMVGMQRDTDLENLIAYYRKARV